MLLNIDKPLRASTLHDEACANVPHPYGTRFKPVGTLGRDGGWFSVSSSKQGKAVADREFPQGAFKVCTYCQESQRRSGTQP